MLGEVPTPWAWVGGGGITGEPDYAIVDDMVNRLANLKTEQWLLWDRAREEEWGLGVPPVTCYINIELEERGGAPAGGHHQKLLIGKQRPASEGGGYYAKFARASTFAFILSEEDVRGFTAPLFKQR